MKRKLLLACVLLIPTLAKATVWPCFGHDTLRTGASPHNGPRSCDIVCTAYIEWSHASPVIDGNGRLYIQGRDPSSSTDWYLWCVNTADCAILWVCTLGAPSLSTLTTNPLSTCAIATDGTIYFGFEEALVAVNSTGTRIQR